MTAPINVHCYADSTERQHVLDASCWCEPTVTTFGGPYAGTFDTTVIDHTGTARPSVLRVPEFVFDRNSKIRGRATTVGAVTTWEVRS